MTDVMDFFLKKKAPGKVMHTFLHIPPSVFTLCKGRLSTNAQISCSSAASLWLNLALQVDFYNIL